MNYRTLGRTDAKVSEIGLGTWPVGGSIRLAGFPTGYGSVPESEAVRAILRGLDLGVSFFDTADSYGLGRAERILGGAVAGRRGQAVLATKAGWVPDGTERWMSDLSRAHLTAAAERSRRRLGVDVIDLFQLHAVPDEGAETDEALDALDELKAREVCRMVGASVGSDMDAGLRLVRSGRIDVLQVHYNLMQQGAATDVLDEARVRRVGVVASIPLAYGFLSGRYTALSRFPEDDWRSQLTPDEIGARAEGVAELRFLTREGARSMVHAALQFVLAHPAVSTTIPGFKNQEQVEDLVAAPDAPPLSDIELARARELARGRAGAAAS